MGSAPSNGDSLRTDGEWAWREDLQSYVRTYRCALPEAFVEKVRQHPRVAPSRVDVPDFVRWSAQRDAERDARLIEEWNEGDDAGALSENE